MIGQHATSLPPLAHTGWPVRKRLMETHLRCRQPPLFSTPQASPCTPPHALWTELTLNSCVPGGSSSVAVHTSPSPHASDGAASGSQLPSALQPPHANTLSPNAPLKCAVNFTMTLPLLLVTTSVVVGALKPVSPGSKASYGSAMVL